MLCPCCVRISRCRYADTVANGQLVFFVPTDQSRALGKVQKVFRKIGNKSNPQEGPDPTAGFLRIGGGGCSQLPRDIEADREALAADRKALGALSM